MLLVEFQAEIDGFFPIIIEIGPAMWYTPGALVGYHVDLVILIRGVRQEKDYLAKEFELHESNGISPLIANVTECVRKTFLDNSLSLQ